TIEDGGQLLTNGVRAAGEDMTESAITVGHAGVWTDSNLAELGYEGNAELHILSGGVVNLNSASFAAYGGSSAEVTIAAGGTLNVANFLEIGRGALDDFGGQPVAAMASVAVFGELHTNGGSLGALALG